MLLSGYRSIFTRISSLRIPVSVLGPYFDRSYQLFGMCQGGSVSSSCQYATIISCLGQYFELSENCKEEV